MADAGAGEIHLHYLNHPDVQALALSDAEIVAVLSWIKSQWPADIRRHQDEVNDAARRRR